MHFLILYQLHPPFFMWIVNHECGPGAPHTPSHPDTPTCEHQQMLLSGVKSYLRQQEQTGYNTEPCESYHICNKTMAVQGQVSSKHYVLQH